MDWEPPASCQRVVIDTLTWYCPGWIRAWRVSITSRLNTERRAYVPHDPADGHDVIGEALKQYVTVPDTGVRVRKRPDQSVSFSPRSHSMSSFVRYPAMILFSLDFICWSERDVRPTAMTKNDVVMLMKIRTSMSENPRLAIDLCIFLY